MNELVVKLSHNMLHPSMSPISNSISLFQEYIRCHLFLRQDFLFFDERNPKECFESNFEKKQYMAYIHQSVLIA